MPEVIVKTKIAIKPPSNLQIYQLTPVKATREMVAKIGAPFGLRTELQHGTITETSTAIHYTEGPWTMQLHRASGGWKYQNIHLWQRDNGEVNFKIEDREALLLAQQQIAKFKLAATNELRPLRVTRLHVADSASGKTDNNERIIDVAVVHERMIDGLPVEGPGGKIVVFFDYERQLSGIHQLWHQINKVYQPVKALRPTDWAIEQIKARFAGTGPGRVEVTEMRLGYFEMNYDHVQEYLQPAYVVFVTLISQDERIHMPSVFAFPAAENSVGLIEPEPRPQPPQTARH
ncbi:MAG: hypothetical protein P4K86_06695 [Terracidiphilus sp.]|nr:hypothetical protein [Terracidiphilus sp.]MDR3776814.1 hypothetical protein [Terracidiphilus sp.]